MNLISAIPVTGVGLDPTTKPKKTPGRAIVGKRGQREYWRVDYTWTENHAARFGHTVETAFSQSEAEAKFSRRCKHVKVVPAD